MKMKIKTIDVHGKEWFDRTVGNSYCSVRTTLNFGMPDQQTLYTVWQYGYGSYYIRAALETLCETMPELGIDDRTPLHKFCSNNKIILRTEITQNCTKREMIAWGQKD